MTEVVEEIKGRRANKRPRTPARSRAWGGQAGSGDDAFSIGSEESIERTELSREARATLGTGGVFDYLPTPGSRSSAARVLIVDSEVRLVRFLRSELVEADYKVLTAPDAITALQLVRSQRLDLIILDVLLPDADGFALCEQIRQISAVPIVIASAQADPASKALGLRLGADDYVAKPFDVGELLARIEAVLRRSRASDDARDGLTADGLRLPKFQSGDLEIDYRTRRVTLRGRELKISPTEYRLLFELTRNAGKALPHEYLLSNVWGPEYCDQVAYLWVYIGYLRQKLEENPKKPQRILTVPRYGYRFRTVARSAPS